MRNEVPARGGGRCAATALADLYGDDAVQLDNLYLLLLLRWLHIFSAIALVGGALFQRIALIGPTAELPDDVRNRLNAAVNRRWSIVVMASALFLLISGGINWGVTVASFAPLKNENSVLVLQQPLFRYLLISKMVLALVIFFLASAVSGRGNWTTRFRKHAAGWLSFNLLLAAIVVALGGLARSLHTGPNVDKVKQVMSLESEAPAWPGK